MKPIVNSRVRIEIARWSSAEECLVIGQPPAFFAVLSALGFGGIWMNRLTGELIDEAFI